MAPGAHYDSNDAGPPELGGGKQDNSQERQQLVFPFTKHQANGQHTSPHQRSHLQARQRKRLNWPEHRQDRTMPGKKKDGDKEGFE